MGSNRTLQDLSGEATVTVRVSIEASVLRDVKDAARRSRQSLSAQMSQALARDLRRQRLAAIISEYEARAGVITDAELAEVRASWQG